jgi:hypothetical protein
MFFHLGRHVVLKNFFTCGIFKKGFPFPTE